MGLSRQPHGDGRALSLPLPVPVSALLQETRGFPGEAETGFGLLLCVSVPGLAQLSLPSAGQMLEMWLWGGGGLHRAELGMSPRATAVAGSWHMSVWGFYLGGTCC